jgi:hypothetical protein
MRYILLSLVATLLIAGCRDYKQPIIKAQNHHVQVGLARRVGQKIVIDTPEKERLWRMSATKAYDDRIKAEKSYAWNRSGEKRQAKDLDIAYKSGKITKSQYEVMRNQIIISFHHKFIDKMNESSRRRELLAELESLKKEMSNLEWKSDMKDGWNMGWLNAARFGHLY